ncbi:alpha/beta fold hydrolase [Streptomyces sp. NPDC090106]|uniref:alpha/beta fold hydrolase n=1 Tax=Streptomyces sp. NPDC090106 TaxID=3365946 RepID=UPI0038065EAF
MLAYDIRGGGPGLVLLPGIGGCSAESWGTLPAELAAGHTVLLPELPGSALSGLPAGPLRLSAVADQVVETARAAGLGRFVIAGTSLGAAVAVSVAARHPDRIRGLFLLSGFARPGTPLWLGLEMWASLHARGGNRLNSFLASLFFSKDHLATLTPAAFARLTGHLATSTPGTAQQIMLALGVDVRADLARITAPTLVVAAMADRFVTPEHSVELADGIPGARLAAVKGGHAAPYEQPERTLEILTGFLHDVLRSPPRNSSAAAAVERRARPEPALAPALAGQRPPHRR